MAKCHTPGRNYCAPNGKIAALFVDIDGTIMECQPYWDGAINEFATLMGLCGFSKKKADETLRKVYFGSMPHRGFERHRLSEAIVEAYTVMCKERKVRRRKEITAICERIGSAPFFRRPSLFENALPVLSRARKQFYLIAVTVGDREVQNYKIRQGGLDAVFDDKIIIIKENKAEHVREVIKDLNIDPKLSAFIGNSVRSDGATLTETNFVYLPLESSLSRSDDKLPENTGFETFQTTDWRDTEERAIQRLIRRRQQLMEIDEDGEVETRSLPSAQPAADPDSDLHHEGCCHAKGKRGCRGQKR